MLRRLASASASTLNAYAETAVRALSTGSELKSLLAEKIPPQQVRARRGGDCVGATWGRWRSAGLRGAPCCVMRVGELRRGAGGARVGRLPSYTNLRATAGNFWAA